MKADSKGQQTRPVNTNFNWLLNFDVDYHELFEGNYYEIPKDFLIQKIKKKDPLSRFTKLNIIKFHCNYI